MTQPTPIVDGAAGEAFIHLADPAGITKIPGLQTFLPDRGAPPTTDEALLGNETVSSIGAVPIGLINCDVRAYERFHPAWNALAAAYRSKGEVTISGRILELDRFDGAQYAFATIVAGVVTFQEAANFPFELVSLGNGLKVGGTVGTIVAVNSAARTVTLAAVGGTAIPADDNDGGNGQVVQVGRQYSQFIARVVNIPGGGFRAAGNVGQGERLVLKPRNLLEEVVYLAAA